MPNKKRAWIISLIIVTCVHSSAAVPHTLAAPDNSVRIAASVTDPLTEKQDYLQQIHVHEAWDIANKNSSIMIGLVDTGVDLDHPDLVPNLIQGVNPIEAGSPPRDDNGHGTNVAGVIAAVPNNERGISGILWDAKLMPIKALERDGTGDETKLGEGIRYAVDNGAKIVVLSLGLNKYSDYMSEIVQYAEDHDVLLVAAAGNEGNRVKYPAAYPTVLAVGGMTADKQADSRSNTGSELDIVAPWDVFTTAIGGGYEYKDGTSMAAPQVAAAAALAWSKYPWMKPYQIRSLIRQTAEDLGEYGWSPSTGYGLLRVDRLLQEPYLEDMYEPNEQMDHAKRISDSKKISASFAGGADSDWYELEAPYAGTVSLTVQTDSSASMQLTHVDGNGYTYSETITSGKTVTLSTQKGLNRFRLQLTDRSAKRSVGYRLTTAFQIYEDEFEDNDRQYQAYVLPERSQTVTGTIGHDNDQDWYILRVSESGILRVTCSVDTARIDPVLFVEKKGEKGTVYDRGGDGVRETTPAIEVFPGDYYIRVSNVKEYAHAVTGEYSLSIEYEPQLVDPNEPNDKSYQATVMSSDTLYEGVFDRDSDVDWYSFQVTNESLVELQLTNVPESIPMFMFVYDSSLRQIGSAMTPAWSTSAGYTQPLKAGTYYAKLVASEPFQHQMYGLTATQRTMLGGFADIADHWAADGIVEATADGLVDGYGDYRFYPDRTITRAEAAALLSRAFELSKQRYIAYSDLSTSHWAYSYVARAAQAGIVDGYPDGSFAPDRPVTRMEMTAMMARAMKLTGKRRGALPFTDVNESYWGTGILKQMKAEGWVSGFPDGTFRPEQQATRAEFVTMLINMVK